MSRKKVNKESRWWWWWWWEMEAPITCFFNHSFIFRISVFFVWKACKGFCPSTTSIATITFGRHIQHHRMCSNIWVAFKLFKIEPFSVARQESDGGLVWFMDLWYSPFFSDSKTSQPNHDRHYLLFRFHSKCWMARLLLAMQVREVNTCLRIN